jgi:6-phosphofructokinase 1
VLNASLFGFLEASVADCEVYGAVNGLQGLDEDRFVSLAPAVVERHRRAAGMPGAWLGSGRWPLDEAGFDRCARNLARRGVSGLVLIGGNGTMWACLQMERAARRVGHEISVLGVPKTVDNDLAGTDHAPGFASAARYVAATVRDGGKDLESMRNFESVRVLETMGRNAGWLAMSAGFLKERPEDPPHLTYIPEHDFDRDAFLGEVEVTYRAYGYAVVVVSEGLLSRADAPLSSPVLGGVAPELASLVAEELGLAARGEVLGMAQRSCALAVSPVDRREARMLGREAARMLRDGRSGMMPGLARRSSSPYEVEIREVALDSVAGVERPLPEEWTVAPGVVCEGFREWLSPLVGEDLAGYPPNITGEAGVWKPKF